MYEFLINKITTIINKEKDIMTKFFDGIKNSITDYSISIFVIRLREVITQSYKNCIYILKKHKSKIIIIISITLMGYFIVVNTNEMSKINLEIFKEIQLDLTFYKAVGTKIITGIKYLKNITGVSLNVLLIIVIYILVLIITISIKYKQEIKEKAKKIKLYINIWGFNNNGKIIMIAYMLPFVFRCMITFKHVASHLDLNGIVMPIVGAQGTRNYSTFISTEANKEFLALKEKGLITSFKQHELLKEHLKDPQEKSIVFATVVSNGHCEITPSGKGLIRYHQSIKQGDIVENFYPGREVIYTGKPKITGLQPHFKTGKIYPRVELRTLTDDVFTEYKKLCYNSEKIKQLPPQIETYGAQPAFVAVLHTNIGTFDLNSYKPNIKLCTDALDYNSCQLLSAFYKEHYGIENKIIKKGITILGRHTYRIEILDLQKYIDIVKLGNSNMLVNPEHSVYQYKLNINFNMHGFTSIVDAKNYLIVNKEHSINTLGLNDYTGISYIANKCNTTLANETDNVKMFNILDFMVLQNLKKTGEFAKTLQEAINEKVQETYENKKKYKNEVNELINKKKNDKNK